jgi:hypothetical protein
MNYTIKLSIILVAVTFFLSSCSKEKIAVNKLEGRWGRAEVIVSENSVECEGDLEPNSIEWTFTAYKVGDQETGSLRETVRYGLNDSTMVYDYSVSEDGSQLTLSDGSTIIATYSISSLSRKEMDLTITQTTPIVTDCGDLNVNPVVPPTIENRMVTTTATWFKHQED